MQPFFLIFGLLCGLVDSQRLLEPFVAHCRHCLRIVQMFKGAFSQPDHPIAASDLSEARFKEIIIETCLAGYYKRYLKEHTLNECEQYWTDHFPSFISLHEYLTTIGDAVEICDRYHQWRFGADWHCYPWMANDAGFIPCNKTKCVAGECCAEDLCGTEC